MLSGPKSTTFQITGSYEKSKRALLDLESTSWSCLSVKNQTCSLANWNHVFKMTSNLALWNFLLVLTEMNKSSWRVLEILLGISASAARWKRFTALGLALLRRESALIRSPAINWKCDDDDDDEGVVVLGYKRHRSTRALITRLQT